MLGYGLLVWGGFGCLCICLGVGVWLIVVVWSCLVVLLDLWLIVLIFVISLLKCFGFIFYVGYYAVAAVVGFDLSCCDCWAYGIYA